MAASEGWFKFKRSASRRWPKHVRRQRHSRDAPSAAGSRGRRAGYALPLDVGNVARDRL